MKYTPETKVNAISRHIDEGESIDAIVTDTGIPRSTLYNWVKQHHEQMQQKSSTPILTQRLYHNLENKIKRLEGIVEILKTIPCIHFYNEQRPHSKIKYKTPNQAEADYADRTAHFSGIILGHTGFRFHFFHQSL